MRQRFFKPAWRVWLVVVLMGFALIAVPADRPPRYTNSDGSVINKSLIEVARWRLSSWMVRFGEAAQIEADAATRDWPVVRDTRLLAGQDIPVNAATWIGHATVLLHLAGKTVLTDPHFSERASPVSWAGPKRQVPPPYALSELPHIDVVLISHNHYDHLDLPTLKVLVRQPRGAPQIFVPPGVEQLLAEEGIPNVRVLSWWSASDVLGMRVTAVPAHHWSARGLTDRNETHWGGWVVETENARVYFAGDTGYSADFKAIGQRFGGFDLALIPVGAYLPRDFMRDQHVDPAEAVRIHQDVGARVSVGIHWGTFNMADESLDAPRTDMALALKASGLSALDFRLLKHGEMLDIKTQRASQ